LSPYAGEFPAIFNGTVLWIKKVKVFQVVEEIKNILYLGKLRKRTPDMGGVFFPFIEQVSGLSTFRAVYPQYLASYPQH
jgi:hypothetical protein